MSEGSYVIGNKNSYIDDEIWVKIVDFVATYISKMSAIVI